MQQLNTSNVPPRPGPEMTLVRLKASESTTVTVLGPLWGLYTHWNGQRTEPCWREKKACEGCRRGYPVRWKGYLHVVMAESRRECFLEVTPGGAEDIFGAVGGMDAPLRGQRLNIRRGGGNKARLKVTLLAAHPPTAILPQSRDPEKTLRALWGCTEKTEVTQQGTTIPFPEAI